MKTNELKDLALDWAVAKCEHDELSMKVIQYPAYAGALPIPNPSTNWAQGGPIIEREFIQLNTILNIETGAVSWFANMPPGFVGRGPTPLIAAMRCYVASKLGDDIEIPKELT